MRQTISELRRRHVFRVVAWYAAAAWLLVQVASTVFPQFDLPDWSVRGVIPRYVATDPLWRLLEGDARVQAIIGAKLPK